MPDNLMVRHLPRHYIARVITKRMLMITTTLIAVGLAGCGPAGSDTPEAPAATTSTSASPASSPAAATTSAAPPPAPPTTAAAPAAPAKKPAPAKPKPKPKPKPTTKKPAPKTDPRYGTCKEANSHGYGPYVRGVDPEYSWYRDADKDGVVCEH